MSQGWTDDVFSGAHVGQTDLQNMENNFGCLKSLFSGLSAPANTVAGMPWFDVSTKKVLKIRNAANSAWLGLMHGDVSQKIWVYRNAAMDGWVVDSAVTDMVLAIKGGTTYITGGITAGAWTISGLTHTHTGTVSSTTVADHATMTIANAALDFKDGDKYPADIPHTAHGHTVTNADASPSDSTWRPAAAVGTLQYLNL